MTYELFTILKLYQKKYPEHFDHLSIQELEQKLPQLKKEVFKDTCHKKKRLAG